MNRRSFFAALAALPLAAKALVLRPGEGYKRVSAEWLKNPRWYDASDEFPFDWKQLHAPVHYDVDVLAKIWKTGLDDRYARPNQIVIAETTYDHLQKLGLA